MAKALVMDFLAVLEVFFLLDVGCEQKACFDWILGS